jgi:hypothetical protein
VASIVDTFSRVCLEKFHFPVTEFACKSVVKKERSGVCRVIYRNGTTAVEIGLEWKEQYIYVEICRLVDGKMKENPIVIGLESDLTVFNMDDLLSIRAPKVERRSKPTGGPLTPDDIEKILTDRALALHRYAQDILRGDFRIFCELDTIVKSRISAYQPSAVRHKIQVHNPVSDRWLKRDADARRFIDQKAGREPVKGVRKEK